MKRNKGGQEGIEVVQGGSCGRSSTQASKNITFLVLDQHLKMRYSIGHRWRFQRDLKRVYFCLYCLVLHGSFKKDEIGNIFIMFNLNYDLSY